MLPSPECDQQNGQSLVSFTFKRPIFTSASGTGLMPQHEHSFTLPFLMISSALEASAYIPFLAAFARCSLQQKAGNTWFGPR
jgi:hypothetical protein